MTQNSQSGGCVLGSLAMSAVIALFALVVAKLVGELSWPGSVFVAGLAFIVAAVIFLVVFCKPLPTLAELNADRSSDAVGGEAAQPKAAAPVAAAEPVETPAPAPAPVPTPTPAAASADVSDDWKPETLDAARDGGPDDLKLIKGIGPKLEKLCHKLGFYHFDQVANWTDNEVAWVDQNLEGFKGRVTRDQWVAQAKILAAGGETEFSQRNK